MLFTSAPWVRSAVNAVSMASCPLGDIAPHGYAAGTPTRQVFAGATSNAKANPLTAWANQATSRTLLANRPTVSSDHEKHLMPDMGSIPKLGLKPVTPQYDAGRITDPPVCVPTANGTKPAATAAAEPADEPPGVRPGALGLSVVVGLKKANSVVLVLPITSPPARRTAPTIAASTLGVCSAVVPTAYRPEP